MLLRRCASPREPESSGRPRATASRRRRVGRQTVGEEHRHRRTLARAALDPQAPAVGVDDPIDDREPQPGAARPRGEERVERSRSNLRVHAFAGVDDVDGEPLDAAFGRGPNADRQRPVGSHRLHRVVDQVVEDLPQQVRVSPDAAFARFDPELRTDPLLVGARERQGPLEEIGQREMGALHVDRSRVAQKVGDEPVQAARLFVEDGQERVVVLARDAACADRRRRSR